MANLSGRVEASFDRNLRFDTRDGNDALVADRNVEKSRRFEATARVGAASRLRIEGGYKHRNVDYSLARTEFRNYQEDSVFVGARYRPANAFTFGADLRRTEGSYPLRFGTNGPEDTLTRNQIDLITNWAPGGPSSVDARVQLRQDHLRTAWRCATSRRPPKVGGLELDAHRQAEAGQAG